MDVVGCIAMVAFWLWMLAQVIEGHGEISQKECDDMQDWIDKYGGLEYGPDNPKPEEA